MSPLHCVSQCPDLPAAKELPLIHSSPSMSDIRYPWCMRAIPGHAWCEVVWRVDSAPSPETYLSGSMEHTDSFLGARGLDTYWLRCLCLVGAEGSSEVRAVLALQQQRSSILSGEKTLGSEEEVGRWTNLHGEGAAHTPSSTFPAETSLISFCGRRWLILGGEDGGFAPMGQTSGLSPVILLLYGVAFKWFKCSNLRALTVPDPVKLPRGPYCYVSCVTSLSPQCQNANLGGFVSKNL